MKVFIWTVSVMHRVTVIFVTPEMSSRTGDLVAIVWRKVEGRKKGILDCSHLFASYVLCRIPIFRNVLYKNRTVFFSDWIHEMIKNRTSYITHSQIHIGNIGF